MKKSKTKIISMIRDCCALPENDINENTEIQSISLDSLSFIQLIVGLEQEFGIEFEDEELSIAKYIKVRDILNLMDKKNADITSK